MTIPTMTVRRGDTLTWTITVADNLTGWTPRLVVKARNGWKTALDTAAVLTLTSGAGLAVTPGTTSTIDVTVSATSTAALTPGLYVWDLQLSKTGEVRTVEWDTDSATIGTLAVLADVTRTTP